MMKFRFNFWKMTGYKKGFWFSEVIEARSLGEAVKVAKTFVTENVKMAGCERI